MRGIALTAALMAGAQALALGGIGPAWAQTGTPSLSGQLSPPSLEPSIKPLPGPPPLQEQPIMPAAPSAAPSAPPAPPEAAPPDSDQPPLAQETAPAADPVVAAIRTKLADPAIAKGADASDLAALQAFYAERSGGPLWITEMGFTAKGQEAIFEIENAGDWGLDPKAFALPSADELPGDADAQALGEIKLDFAILEYARHARGGRLVPAKVSELFDQTPHLRDPNTVLAEIGAAEAPDAYLRSLQPKHEQFERLRQALLKARSGGGEEADAKGASDKDIKRLIINMERWRWMPEDLGSLYVWNNSADFMLFVVKDNKTIYADKTLVGTVDYATPVFSADMKTIVFNPDWNAPETVVKENIIPPLQKGNYSILRVHKLFVSYNGQPVDATKVDWSRVNPLAYTFSQKAGPHNNLGKVKFLFPNRHTVYMHDTLPVRKKYFKQTSRMIGHECVRMEKPQQFAEVLLAADKGWSAARVKELWETGNNASVPLEKKIPVHMVYFTAIVGDDGKIDISTDVYGLDRKMAAALFGDATGFPAPPPAPKQPPPGESDASAPAARRTTADNDFTRAMGGFADN